MAKDSKNDEFQSGEAVLQYLEECSGKKKTLPALHHDFSDEGEWLAEIYDLNKKELGLLRQLYDQWCEVAKKKAQDFQSEYPRQMLLEGLLLKLQAWGIGHFEQMNSSELFALASCDPLLLAKAVDIDLSTAKMLQRGKLTRLAQSKISCINHL